MKNQIDALGNELKENDRVCTYDLDGTKVSGILKQNEYNHVSDWCVEYDDGECCAVLDFSLIWKD